MCGVRSTEVSATSAHVAETVACGVRRNHREHRDHRDRAEGEPTEVGDVGVRRTANRDERRTGCRASSSSDRSARPGQGLDPGAVAVDAADGEGRADQRERRGEPRAESGRSALGAWLASTLALVGASLAVGGVDGNRAWIEALTSDRYHEVVQIGQSWMMHGIPSALVSLLPSSYADVAQLVGLALGAVLVVAMLLVVRRTPQATVSATWALVALTSVLLTPHILSYDLVLLIPAVLHLARGGGTRTTRLSLLALFLLTWTAWPRHELAALSPWLGWFGVSWAFVPLLLLWRESHRDLTATTISAEPTEVDSAADKQVHIAELTRRRAGADVVWMLGLLLMPGYLVGELLGDAWTWIAAASVLLIVVGGILRARQTRALWAADPDHAPVPWKRTWLMDLDEPDRKN